MVGPEFPFANRGGRPYTRGGLGRCAVWLSGGRVACSLVDHGGIEEICYFGAQPLHRHEFFRASFRSAYPRVFRAQLIVEDRLYTLGVGDGQLHPSGWTGTLAIPEESLELELALVCTNQAIIQAVRATRNPRRHRIGLRLMLRDYTRVEAPHRTWNPWKIRGRAAICTVIDTPEKPSPNRDAMHESQAGQAYLTYSDSYEPRATWIGVVGDGAVRMRSWRSQLRSFAIDPARRDEVGLALIFGSSQSALRAQRRHLATGISSSAWATIAKWSAAERLAPRPQGLPPVVASYVQQAPALLSALMPQDIAGAQRSSFNSYWVWGWDSMFHAHVCLLAGLNDAVRDMLALLARTADAKYGIGHSFDPQMRTQATQLLPAQGLFATAAWQQWAVAGDLSPARQHWEFLTTWLKRTLSQPRRDGLLIGMALFPDFPQDAGQNGNDLTPVMNSIFYQACRCMEHLAAALGDTAVAASAADAAAACGDGFGRLLWDTRKGFWYDSVDSITLRGRPSYPSHAIFWTSPFARELIADAEAAAQFMEKNHRIPGGIRMYPKWDPAFNADGNQLGQHYPPGQDPLYLRLMAMTGRSQRLREWLGWLQTHWCNLTIPEGTTLEADNDGPQRPDNPGGRQLFTIKSWYDGIVGTILGISCDPAGLTVEPGLPGPLAWHGMPLHGRNWDISVSGKGPHVAKVAVGKTIWTGTCKVPLPAKGSATIAIHRTAKVPRHPVLLSADGARVLSSAVLRNTLRLRLRSSGRTLMRLWLPRKSDILVDGEKVPCTWNAASRIADAWLPASANDVQVSIG